MDFSEVSALEEIFARHRDRRWIFVRPGGNWGDHLIYLGAASLARRVGVEWIDADFRTFPQMGIPPESLIYLHGGGGFNSWGSGRAFEMLALAATIPGAVVIQGPQTCEIDNPAVGERFARLDRDRRCSEVVMFARERTSWRYMREHLPKDFSLCLAHDTALSLSFADLLGSAELKRRPAGRYELVVVRQDDEMPDEVLAATGSALRLDPAIYANTFRHWLRIHLYARSIVTNRLHSAIAGAIAGIPVFLLPGGYHKNRSLWDFSLKTRGVRWAEEVPTSATRGIDLLSLLPTFLSQSWKVRRLVMRLKGMPRA